MPPRRKYSDEERRAAVRLVLDEGQEQRAAAEQVGVNPGTLAKWVRAEWTARRGREWADRVEPHFGFLTGHGFDRIDVDGGDAWGRAVVYRSPVNAVRVEESTEFRAVEVTIMRVVDGELPDPLWRNSVFLGSLVALKTGEARLTRHQTERLRGLDAAQVERQLAFWARALREHGADFLAGDPGVVDRVRESVRARRPGS